MAKCWLQQQAVRDTARKDDGRTLFPETAQHRWSEGYWREREALPAPELSAIFSAVRVPSAAHDATRALPPIPTCFTSQSGRLNKAYFVYNPRV